MKLYFGREGSTSRPEGDYILISPCDTRWDDFGRNYHAQIKISMGTEGAAFSCRALVMPLEWNDIEAEKRLDQWVNRQLFQIGGDLVSPDVGGVSNKMPKFVTLLEGEQAYRSLSREIANQTTRHDILRLLNDIVYLIDGNVLAAEATQKILQTENFQFGFLRRGTAYRALHRGARHIWSNVFGVPGEARRPFSFECEMEGFGSAAHTLFVDYVDTIVLQDRIHCLVGKNGCGKTRLLKELILHLSKVAEKPESSRVFVNNDVSTARSMPTFEGPTFGRVLCFSADSYSVYPAGTRTDAEFEYIFSNLNAKDRIDEDGSSTSNRNLTRLLVDILRNADPLQEAPYLGRRQIFEQALEKYVRLETVHLPLLPDAPENFGFQDTYGNKWINAEEITYLSEKQSLRAFSYVDINKEVDFFSNKRPTSLSSGHRVFFKFAVSFLSYIDVGTLVILDEPETHLHPNLVCDFMNLLYDVLTPTYSVALIATHSAYVVREVPTHCAHVYEIDEDLVPTERRVYLQTLGANIENISQAVFGDSNVDKFHQKIADRMVNERTTLEEVIRDYSALMSPDLLSRIARLITSRERGLDADD